MNYAKLIDKVNFDNLRKSLSYIKRYGLGAFYHKAIDKIKSNRPIVVNGVEYEDPYQAWIEKNEPDVKELNAQRTMRFQYEPKISIIVPTFNTPKQFLIDMVESVLAQTYSNWELCIADGASQQPPVKKVLDLFSGGDERVQVKYLTQNKGITGNSNEALSLAIGDYVALLDHDDTLAPFALFEIVKAINENPAVDFIYSDEDKMSKDGKNRFDHFFKPDWSPDTLRSHNYICHLTVIKKELLDEVGLFREGYDGSQDHDLILRATEKANKILHIPKILYHWRVSSSSTAGDISNKMYAFDSGKKAISDHLTRMGLSGKVEDGLFLGSYKVTYNLKKTPTISIIIPNKDHSADLEKCVKSVINKSSYKNIEIIIVENGSVNKETFELYDKLKRQGNIKIIKWDKPFNYAAINNYALNYSRGEILLFLNNDVEVITPDWLERMLEHVLRSEVGAVGAKLYYPDNTIQHAGVILGIGGIAGHSHKYYSRNSHGYFSRLGIIQNLSAVTGACLMVRRDLFNDIQGFDEGYSHAFNDVDLCMKIREKGYLIVFTPHAELYHHESKTRGLEDTLEKQERFRKEIELFKQKWQHILDKGDPYYNPNLTLEKEDFSISTNLCKTN